MTSATTRIAPPNSLIFISDPDGGEAPYPVRGAMILATQSCVSVRCYPEIDGPTEIVLGNAKDVDPGLPAAFADDVDTPNHAVVISTVEAEALLRQDVPGSRTRVSIWLSHPAWPEKVIVGLG